MTSSQRGNAGVSPVHLDTSWSFLCSNTPDKAEIRSVNQQSFLSRGGSGSGCVTAGSPLKYARQRLLQDQCVLQCQDLQNVSI